MVPVGLIKAAKEAVSPETKETRQQVAEERRRAREESAVQARRYVNGVSLAAFFVCLAAGLVAAVATDTLLIIPPAFLVAFFLLFSIKVARQWEKAIVLRLGKFTAMKGPGPFLIIPVIDDVAQIVDQRVRVTDVSAESALTKDTVPVNVDAIVFWTVWDAKKAILEVSDYHKAITLSAQTALRETIGRHMLAEMITERDQLGKQLQSILDEKTNPWGITVGSVEIRDVKIPADLEDAMSRQAQAERERQARIILGTAETEIAERFVSAGQAYTDKPVALHLRAMNMLYEAIKEKGSMVIVPSSAVETMGLGGLLGTASLAGKGEGKGEG